MIKGPYRFKGTRIIGLERNGVERTSIMWSQMTASVAHNLGLTNTCRDMGTEMCLNCEEQIANVKCRFECEVCEHVARCPCSLIGWKRRTLEV